MVTAKRYIRALISADEGEKKREFGRHPEEAGQEEGLGGRGGWGRGVVGGEEIF